MIYGPDAGLRIENIFLAQAQKVDNSVMVDKYKSKECSNCISLHRLLERVPKILKFLPTDPIRCEGKRSAGQIKFLED